MLYPNKRNSGDHCNHTQGFSLDHLDVGGQVLGDKALMRGDIDLMGVGPNFDRLYNKLKVLLLLLIPL